MSTQGGRGVSLETIQAIESAHAIDRAERYSRSERGFNDAMRVRSDAPSPTVRLKDGSRPGMFVAFQRVRSGRITYKQRVAGATPLAQRKTKPMSVYADIGSTFEQEKRRSRTPDIRGISIAQALGLA